MEGGQGHEQVDVDHQLRLSSELFPSTQETRFLPPDARARPEVEERPPVLRRSQGRRLGGTRKNWPAGEEVSKADVSSGQTAVTTTELAVTTAVEYDEEEDTTITPVNIFDGQYHEVNPGQYQESNPGHLHYSGQYHEESPGRYWEQSPGQYGESNPGQYHEINPGQYETVVEFNEQEATKSYNVHQKTGDYIIGEVGKINKQNGQTLEGVRYTAVEGMVDQAQIAEILQRYFGAGW